MRFALFVTCLAIATPAFSQTPSPSRPQRPAATAPATQEPGTTTATLAPEPKGQPVNIRVEVTITWNQAINRRRTLARWWRHVVSPGAHDDAQAADAWVASDETPERLAADQQLRRDVKREILALPPKLRDALLLAQSGDYTYDEMGSMLKAPAGTIKWRVSEGRRLIKERLRARGHTHVG